MWEVIQTEEFNNWFCDLRAIVQNKIVTQIKVIHEQGPGLGRPLVDTIKGSKLKNLKELRQSVDGQVVRIFFVFDPDRKAILLIGASKNTSGDKHFYSKMILLSEKIYDDYLNVKIKNRNLK